jgi:hypothetical protein
VAAFVLSLLFFSTGERIFFKAAVDDMAPFRYFRDACVWFRVYLSADSTYNEQAA